MVLIVEEFLFGGEGNPLGVFVKGAEVGLPIPAAASLVGVEWIAFPQDAQKPVELAELVIFHR